MKTGMHYGCVDKSPRLKAILGFLMSRGLGGATTVEIHDICGALNPATEVSAIRHQGYSIDCKYEGRGATGSKIYRYTLIQPAHVEGLLF